MFKAHFLKLGRTDGILLDCGSKFVFIDGGYRKSGPAIKKQLHALGVNKGNFLAYVATHGHKNHIETAAYLIDAFRPEVIVAARAEVFTAIHRYAKTQVEKTVVALTPHMVMRAGDTMAASDATISCLGPEKIKKCSTGAYSENYNSLILRVDCAGSRELLLTGDSTASIIAKCGAAARAITLKNPHHAGAQPLTLLKQVQPRFVVVCSNVRPRIAYRKRISKYGAALWCTCDGNTTI